MRFFFRFFFLLRYACGCFKTTTIRRDAHSLSLSDTHSRAHTHQRAPLYRNDSAHMHKSTTIQRIFSMCITYIPYLSYAWRIISFCSAASQQHKLNIRAIQTHTHTLHTRSMNARTYKKTTESIHSISFGCFRIFHYHEHEQSFSFFSVSAHSLTCVLFIIIFTTHKHTGNGKAEIYMRHSEMNQAKI